MLHTFEQEKPGCAPDFSALFTELFSHKPLRLQRRHQRLVRRAGQRAFLVYAVLADGVGEGRGVLVDRRCVYEGAHRRHQRLTLFARYMVVQRH